MYFDVHKRRPVQNLSKVSKNCIAEVKLHNAFGQEANIFIYVGFEVLTE
jgi:hypothetical protein